MMQIRHNLKKLVILRLNGRSVADVSLIQYDYSNSTTLMLAARIHYVVIKLVQSQLTFPFTIGIFRKQSSSALSREMIEAKFEPG